MELQPFRRYDTFSEPSERDFRANDNIVLKLDLAFQQSLEFL